MNGTPAAAGDRSVTDDRLIAHCCVSIEGVMHNLALYSEQDRAFYVRATTRKGSGRIRPFPAIRTEEQAIQWHVDLIMLYWAAKKRREALHLATAA